MHRRPRNMRLAIGKSERYGFEVRHTVTLDGEQIDSVPRSFAGEVFVLGSMEAIASMMTEDDYAIGSPKKGIGTVVFRRRKVSKWTSLTGWGYEGPADNEFLARDFIEDIYTSCESVGIEPAMTASQTVGRLLAKYRRFVEDNPVPQEAIHGGPIFHASGGGEGISHYDRRSAFLHAVGQPLPTLGAVWTPEFNPYKADLVIGTMIVPGKNRRVGPLNMVGKNGGIEYPTGMVTGAWVGPTLDLALQNGAIFANIKGAYRCRSKGQWLAQEFEQISQLLVVFKPAAKALYTRLWGLLVPSKTYRGTIVRAQSHELEAVPAFGLWFRPKENSRVGLTDAGAAAWIASVNYAETMGAVMRNQSSIVAAHVDAVWVGGKVQEGEGIGEWKRLGTGRVHFLRPGTYVSPWKVGRMAGDPERILSGEHCPDFPVTVESWNGRDYDARKGAPTVEHEIRSWTDKPEHTIKADSTVIRIER